MSARDLLIDPEPVTTAAPLNGVVVGELVAIVDQGCGALVLLPGRASAVRARSTIDLHAAHLGREVLLAFEADDAARPIVTGVLRTASAALPPALAGQVELDANGERLLISAQQQLVLRCGAACITLRADGAVLIQGNYVSSQSTGVNRIWGGTVQLN